MNFTNQSDVTVVLTSCNRPTLLEETLRSFDEFNTYPLHSFIIIDDSGVKGCNDKLKEKYPFITWIENDINKGQAYSIDKAYSLVTTPYIFHCEEDWQFYAPGFIEQSKTLLENKPNILQVWIRAENDTNGHPVYPKKYNCKGVDYRTIITNHLKIWHGFSFNPGLRRLKDYKLLGSFSQYGTNGEHGATVEANVGKFYKDKGYISAIISGNGFVKHIGEFNNVPRTLKEQKQHAAFIIPYRNRQAHLSLFIPTLTRYLAKQGFRNYHIYIVEQADSKPFNRAKLLNIGADIAKDTAMYYIFHDVDMRPKDVDYRYSLNPCHIATKCSQFNYKMPYPDYFGGVTIFDKEVFYSINGYSNNFWGWGGEDDESVNRVKAKGLIVDRRQCVFECSDHKRDYSHSATNAEKVNKIDANDGLSSLEYKEILRSTKSNVTHIKVLV
jgi:hypothetical protein